LAWYDEKKLVSTSGGMKIGPSQKLRLTFLPMIFSTKWLKSPRQSLASTIEFETSTPAMMMKMKKLRNENNMPSTIFTPGPTPNTVRSPDGTVKTAPTDWMLLPPGDAALTRRVKAAGDHWVVQEKKGRKIFSRGVWAPSAVVEKIKTELEIERSADSYVKKKEADARRRDKAQTEYVEDFRGAVLKFLAFHPAHADLAQRLAHAVADQATPVGSGTVARTKRIPIEERAEAAVIAWLRHQTTAYDSMVIPRIKGKRREVRRMLAQRSKELLSRYRKGEAVGECPLKRALTVMR
jgi:hypothetical protein